MSQIDELRQIIVGDSSEQLTELKDRIEDLDRRTNDVAEVLSPAIDVEIRNGGQRLVSSLQEPVSRGLKQAIRAEPKAYAEILYPVMAPSIRRAIAQAVSSLMVTVNRTIESATSVQGIRMRIQSMRTGIPYAELAMRQLLLYRVEHIYLIDRETGMLVNEVASEDSQSLDSDAVGAMFSAIQSFVQDSFSQDAGAQLTDLKVGDYNVWVAHGTKLMLACVIQGDAPESLKSQLYDALDNIRIEYATPIAEFNGDNNDFAGVDLMMAPLLQMQLKDDDIGFSKSSAGSPKTLVPLLILILICGYFGYTWFSKANSVAIVEHYLREAPGIAPTEVYWEDDQVVVEGLKDPDAEIPFGTLASYKLPEEKLRFKMIPFRSLEVDMELQRFRQELVLPDSVELGSREGKVILYGTAPLLWLVDNDVRIRQLSADRRMDISKLSADCDSVSELLTTHFSLPDWRNYDCNTVLVDQQEVAQISGQLEESKLALLKVFFADSHWVLVAATPLQPRTQPDSK